jgi:hypothetical protein
MNLDELKSSWNTENTGKVRIPENINELGKAKHPLDKLKQNMRNEWFVQVAAVLMLGFLPQIQNLNPSLYPLYYVAYTFMVIVSVYYLELFRRFYTRITHYTEDTKESLTEVYNEFRLNIERYHSFGFLLLPFGLASILISIYNLLLEKGKDFDSLPQKNKLILLVSIVAILLLLVFSILGWTKYYYGKYLNQLKSALDELKEDQ